MRVSEGSPLRRTVNRLHPWLWALAGAIAGALSTLVWPQSALAESDLMVFPATDATSIAVALRAPATLKATDYHLSSHESEKALARQVSTSVPTGSGVVHLSVRAPSEAQARDLNQALITTIATLTEDARTGISVAAIGGDDAITVSQPRPSAWGFAALGALLAGTSGLVYRVTRARRRPLSDVDVQALSGLQLLGRLDAEGQTQPHRLRDNLRLAQLDRPNESLVIAGCRSADDAGAVATQLARSVAESGRRVVLVDADLTTQRASPRITDQWGVSTGIGLTSVLLGEASLGQAVQSVAGLPLRLLGAGPLPAASMPIAGSRITAELLSGLSAEAVVIVDAPPVLDHGDAALLAAGRQLLLVTGSRARSDLRAASAQLLAAGVDVVGVVTVDRVRPDADTFTARAPEVARAPQEAPTHPPHWSAADNGNSAPQRTIQIPDPPSQIAVRGRHRG